MNLIPAIVLHVEDDANDRFLVEVAFARAGVPVFLRSVEDGELAVAYLKGEGSYSDRDAHPFPNLMLLDLKLPRLSGFEVLSFVRAQENLKGLPVVILSSSAEKKDISRAHELGADQYVVKPVSIRELNRSVKEIAFKWLMKYQISSV